MVTLVIGLPGSGKTTWVRTHLGDGLAYDLDRIAEAFCLRRDGEGGSPAARRLANTLALGFAQLAPRYAADVYVIRTAPGVEELRRLKPERVVVCARAGEGRLLPERELRRLRQDIDAACAWCGGAGVPVVRARGA